MPSSNHPDPPYARRPIPEWFDWQPLPCRQVDPDFFYPEPRGPNTGGHGKELCHECPIELACRAWAVGTGQAWGTWGGMTANARHKLSAAQRAAIVRDGETHLAELCQTHGEDFPGIPRDDLIRARRYA